MRKQTLILTAWLAMPFICLTLIMAWIFVSLDKDRLMNEPPVGAGAGDTGNANALGQLLAGRDPDEISKANQARREHIRVDPFNWPGGTILTFEHKQSSDLAGQLMEARLVIETKRSAKVSWPRPIDLGNNRWGVLVDPIKGEIESVKIAVVYQSDRNKISDFPLVEVPLDPIIAGDTLSSDPIEIPVRIDVVMP